MSIKYLFYMPNVNLEVRLWLALIGIKELLVEKLKEIKILKVSIQAVIKNISMISET